MRLKVRVKATIKDPLAGNNMQYIAEAIRGALEELAQEQGVKVKKLEVEVEEA